MGAADRSRSVELYSNAAQSPVDSKLTTVVHATTGDSVKARAGTAAKAAELFGNRVQDDTKPGTMRHALDDLRVRSARRIRDVIVCLRVAGARRSRADRNTH